MTSHPPTSERLEHARGGKGRAIAASTLVGALALSGFGLALPAQAAVSADADVVINEVYGGGGNSGATLTHDFIELVNVSDAPVDITGWTLQYASATGAFTNQHPLTGTIAPGSSFLVQEAKGTGGTAALPTPDATGTLALAGGGGKVALASTTTSVSGPTADNVVDYVAWGASSATPPVPSTPAAGGSPAPATTNATSVSRNAAHANTAVNAADFTAGAPTPTNSGTGENPDPEPTVTPNPTETPTPTPTPTETAAPQLVAIDAIQGTGTASTLVGQTVITEGVVTAHYPTGGFDGYVIQTAGSGGAIDFTKHLASDAVFVYSATAVNEVALGDTVRVTGQVTEFNGLTEITVGAGGAQVIADAAAPVPATSTWPANDAQREVLESMLIAPQGTFTVSDTYSTNQYGEVGLASGATPLRQPTDAAPAGSAQAAAVAADNLARGVVLDDGATTNYLNVANAGLTPPYVSLTEPVVVGGKASFTAPLVVDFRNDLWKLNPITPVVGNGTGTDGVSFTNPRTAAPASVGGDVSVASFNVLNYFTTLGTDNTACQSYTPLPNGEANSVRTGCDQRGAWDAADFDRQEAKIVAAIEDLDASVVGLMEIENSAALGEATDEAVSTLVDALNAAAGSEKWAFVPSSLELPDPSTRDVITNAIIYQPALVERVGDSRALGTESDDNEAFGNAREPIGQAFEPAGGGEPFLFVVNHFKSKGSAGPWPGDVDTGDGQGASNESRERQAAALRDWIPTIQGSTESVVLVGDFNSYSQEDPLQLLYRAGYVDAEGSFELGESSYSFDGLVGSLDHVLLNGPARERATGADIWNINSGESIALEYSRYGYHGTKFYEADPYRSSDHDPVKVGLTAGDSVNLTLLGINDFHGRIDANTVKFAGTIEQQRAIAAGESLFLSAGDNIGASLPASSLFGDQPTIDVLNALELETSAVGNHELDKGFADLSGRVEAEADYSHLAANMYLKGTDTPALDEYATFEREGLTVAVIGAITEETPSLVSPAGIETLEFGDPVEAVNRVASELTDGDAANGEADVIIAMYHEGAGAGTPDGATLEEEIAGGGAFASIVEDTSAEVDAIFTGHTHKEYAWSAPIPGVEGATRPIVQTGSYGANIGKIVLNLDPETGDLLAHSEQNIPRSTANDDALAAAYPRAAAVQQIVKNALAEYAVIGNTKVADISGDITTAFSGGSFVNGVWTAGATGKRDDRASESALGNLVAEALRSSMATLPNGAEIGVTNSGGLRSELYDTQAEFGGTAVATLEDGEISFGQAYAVTPFSNTMAMIDLTGDQFTQLLEQQWQTNPDGTIPSRPYLQLGLSENVTYTYDAALPAGSRITSVTVNGEPLDPAREYRIGTLSFLAAGGDNFRAFTGGTDYVDTGLLDYEAWIEYLGAQSSPEAPLEPQYDKHAVSVQGVPETAAQGSDLSFLVSNLNMTSLGAPEATELTATLGDEVLGTFPITAGSAQVAITLPAGTAAGAASVVLTTDVAGTEVTVPIQVTTAGGTPGEAPNGSWATVTLNDRVEQGGLLTVTVTGLEPGQQIGATLFSDPIVVTGIPAADASGRTSFVIAIPADFALGAHQLVVTTAGEDPITVGVTVVADGQLAVTGSELPLGIAFAAGFLLVAGGLAFALRRRSPVTR